MTDVPPFTTDDFRVASTPEQIAEGLFALRVPEGWQQGRGAFGGLVLASLERAIEGCEMEAARTLRSFSGEITGPVLAGPAEIRVTPLRRGSGVSTWSATLTQAGEIAAHATAVLGRTRMPEPAFSPPAPAQNAPWDDPRVVRAPAPAAPHFARFFELRPTGPLPFSGAKEPVAAGWVRFAKPPPSLGAPEVVALADAWWPAGIATEAGPRPIGTIAFTLQMFAPREPLDPGEPLFHRARALAAQGGFVVEQRELWTSRGELVALNQQTFVWIR